ncbi:MAG: hypothetical protein DIU75_004540 [Mycolicibacterium hassiacum]|jgi:hypothetical protein
MPDIPNRSGRPPPGGSTRGAVTGLGAGVAWYQRVFGLDRLPTTFPHHGCEDTGYAVVLVDAASGVAHTGVRTVDDPMPFRRGRCSR